MPSDSERAALPFEPKGRSKSNSKASRTKSSKPSESSKGASQRTSEGKNKRKSVASDESAGSNEVSAAARAKAEKIGLKKKNPKRSASSSRSKRQKPEPEAIPEVVSQRMIKRMLFFSGLPTGLAAVIFVGSYIVLIQQIWEVPTTLVLLSTLGCFGLGVLGLSYGVLSASWEESQPGSRLGWAEFQVNFGRMASAWRKPKADD